MQTFRIETVDDVREYVNEDYWERGTASGKSGYDNWFINRDWDDLFVRHLDQAFNVENKVVLDVGCALGGIVLSLLRHKADAFGIDISDYAVNKGQQKYPELIGKTFIGSAHKMPYADAVFDLIHSNQVFEHVPESAVPAMMKDIARVMKPGAIAWVGLVMGEGGRGPDDKDHSHICIKPVSWWRDQVEVAGLIFDMSIDQRFRATNLQFFREYGWHSFSFRKAGG